MSNAYRRLILNCWYCERDCNFFPLSIKNCVCTIQHVYWSYLATVVHFLLFRRFVIILRIQSKVWVRFWNMKISYFCLVRINQDFCSSRMIFNKYNSDLIGWLIIQSKPCLRKNHWGHRQHKILLLRSINFIRCISVVKYWFFFSISLTLL